MVIELLAWLLNCCVLIELLAWLLIGWVVIELIVFSELCTQNTKNEKKKGSQCPKDEPLLTGECCKSFSWFIRYQTINEENTEHRLPLY